MTTPDTLGRCALLDQLETMAASQRTYFDRKQQELPCLDSYIDEEGYLKLPDDIGPLLQQCSANGRFSEADWWLSAIRTLKEKETATAEPEPQAAWYEDSTGCFHMSLDVALIAGNARDNGHEIHYLYGEPVEPQAATSPPLLHISAHEYAMEYEFRADEGAYTPTDGERAMIEDAINGFLGENEISPTPASDIAALREENNVGIGMAIAAAILMRVWGKDTEAKEILGAAGLTTAARLREIGVEDYDLDELRPILDGSGSALQHVAKGERG